MKILGLDPANKCGFAHSDGTHGTWKLKLPKDRHPGRRLHRLRRFLFAIKRDHGIDVIGYEDASFGSKNPNTMARHNELAGVIQLCAAEWDIPAFSFKPTHIKKFITDDGGASKEQMMRAIELLYGIRTRDDNIADAIAVMERARVEATSNPEGFYYGEEEKTRT